MNRPTRQSAALALACAIALAGCGPKPATDEHGHGAEAAEGFERGAHGGRLLEDGDFSLEVTIFEEGVEPQFRVYAYRKGKPVAPDGVSLAIDLTRLGGRVDRIAFKPAADHLQGDKVVSEPHSFDVAVRASEGGRSHQWRYASYEGRTVISEAAAKAGGVKTAAAGPAVIGETIDMAGRVEIKPEGKGEVRAWYPGRIMSMNGQLGQAVRKGQVLARVESSESLQTYAIPAPISGIIVEKNANTGDVAYERPLFVIADPTKLHAEFFVYPRDAERVKVGQTVQVRSLSGATQALAKVEAILPTADLASQTLTAHVHIPASLTDGFRPGMGVEGAFQVSAQPVALAVETKALQRFRDAAVVFAKVGETYEVRMLQLGRRTPQWTEVLGGLEPGTQYVTDGAFLIRADIEKSGASHDH